MKQILCFGDSNTYGYIPETAGRYDWDTRWTGRLDKKIRDNGYRVIEEGLCGRTTVFDDPLRAGRRGTEMLPILLETHKPIDTVILMLGTNDCKSVYNASAEVIGKGIEGLLAQIEYSNPDAKVLLISPIQLGEKVWEEGFDPEFNEVSVATSKKLPEVYRRIAREHNISFLPASKYAKPSEADREHMTVEGHERLADAIWDKIVREWN